MHVSKAIQPSGGRVFSRVFYRFSGWLDGPVAWLDLGSPRAAYVLRSIAAAALALTLAYLLDLEMPYSAASTVLLVIHPVQGAVIGKGTWRVVGTLVGMLVALLLMSAFAQMPWLFLLGFGAWLGICVAGMTLFRHFRASGTVVAGYTVGLATFGAMQHAELTFEQIVGRGSTVMLGVVCLGVVSALFSRRSVRHRLDGLLSRLLIDAAGMLETTVAPSASDGATARVTPQRRALIAEIYAVDDLLSLGKAESADLALQARTVRHAMASLFAAVVGGSQSWGRSDERAPALQAARQRLEGTWHDVAAALSDSPRDIDRATQLLQQARVDLLAALDGVPVQAQTDGSTDRASVLIAGDRWLEQIDDYLAALPALAVLSGATAGFAASAPLARVPFHRDMGAAVRNGLRAMLTLVLAGAFWVATGWPQGDMMLLVLAPYCALLATAGNPAAGAVEFVKGTVVAVPMAFVCAFGVLPHLGGLPLLLVMLALFWLPGIYATAFPKYALAGLAYLVGFNTLVAAANPMVYDLGQFLNGAVAWVLATLFTLLGFRLLLPRDPAHEVERLRLRIRDASLAVLRGRSVADRGWSLRQQHRLAQLGAALKARPAAMDTAIGDGLASLHLGRELRRLQQWVAQASPESKFRSKPRSKPRSESPAAELHQRVSAGLQRMAHRADRPLLAARHARRAARSLACQRTDDGGAADVALERQRLRLVAALVDIAEMLQTHAAYFSTDSSTVTRSPVDAQ